MFKTVLVPVDVSVPEDAQRLLAAAKTLTAGWDCTLHITTVIPNVGMAIVGAHMEGGFEAQNNKAAKDALAQTIAASGLKATSHVVIGKVYDRVIHLAEKLDVDLILIGAHQPELRDYLLGSNAARVVRHSNRSVLVLRNT